MPDQTLPDSPFPSGWAKNVKSVVLHVVSLARFAIVEARGLAAKGSDGSDVASLGRQFGQLVSGRNVGMTTPVGGCHSPRT